mmetsp:Transcript_7704/g.22505  ORF Transcript_7704/g.22505 Transcript_7704/m.22505 type:complete len:207 (+) Transcript_7704:1-621(+)
MTFPSPGMCIGGVLVRVTSGGVVERVVVAVAVVRASLSSAGAALPCEAQALPLADHALGQRPVVLKVHVVSVAEAELAGRHLGVLGAPLLLREWQAAQRGGLGPEDEVAPRARGDVVCAVAVAAQVEHRAAGDVGVLVAEFAVLLAAEDAAEGEARALEVAAQAGVEGHLRVVVVHVQVPVSVRRILHREGVVVVQGARAGHGGVD